MENPEIFGLVLKQTKVSYLDGAEADDTLTLANVVKPTSVS